MGRWRVAPSFHASLVGLFGSDTLAQLAGILSCRKFRKRNFIPRIEFVVGFTKTPADLFFLINKFAPSPSKMKGISFPVPLYNILS